MAKFRDSDDRSPHDREEKLRRREEQLKERELQLRLRELEAEIYQPPLYQTTKHTPSETRLQRWTHNLKRIAIFCGIVISVVVLMRIAAALAGFVMVGAVSFVIYKLFFDNRPTP